MIGTRGSLSPMVRPPGPAIRELERNPEPGAVEAFLAEHELPLVEGRSCTFVYRGEADAVRLRHWIYGLASGQDFSRIPGTDLWYLVLELPESSRIEYKLEVRRGRRVELVQDPLNPRLAHDPFGANSVLQAEGYQVPEWTRPDPEARKGKLDEREFRSRALGGSRRVVLYFPARFRRTRRYPLLVAHDGPDYLRYSALRTVLDNLIHRLEIPGMVVALTEPGERMEEYTASDAHARFLGDELVPALERELPLQPGPGGRGLLGASLGAVAALHAASRRPGFYGKLLLQSGSFAFTDIGEHDRGPAFDRVVEFVNEFRQERRRVSEQVYVSCGMYEALIFENRSLVPVLQETGMRVRYQEARDGHNWENWRDRLRAGLSWLFPGPLWMVYE